MRTGDYVNAEYDRKLAEYKALKAQMKQENQAQHSQMPAKIPTSQPQTRQVQQAQQKPAQQSQNSNPALKRYY